MADAPLNSLPDRKPHVVNPGLKGSKSADLVVHDCRDAAMAVTELVSPVYRFKRGRQTFTREPAVLHGPQ